MKHTYISSVYMTFSVLGHLTLVVRDSLEPPGRRVRQVHEVLLREVRHPHQLDGVDKLGEGGGLELLSL